jgi:hypothetical protein
LKTSGLRNKFKNISKKACEKEKDAYFCTRFENESGNKKE